jgi:FolB domain-containing protein
MSDLIRIVDLEVWTHIGVPDEERAQPQRLLINLEMRVGDISKAAAEDDIARTVNYFDVAQYITNFAQECPRKLLERFAEELADGLLGAFPIKKLRLEVKKFILPNAHHIAVEIERKAKKAKKISEL